MSETQRYSYLDSAKMRSILILIVCMLVACTSIRDQTHALNGAIADTATTVAALHKSGVVESNPMGFPATVLFKGIMVTYLHYYPNDSLDKAAGSIWWGAAANNIAVVIGLTNPLSIAIGVGVGVGLWINSQSAQEELSK
jgi:hypothetical protein